MLQWINDRMKVIGWIFILPLALVFAVWGVHGLVDFTTRQDRGVRVNGQDVDVERLRQVYQEQLAQAHRAFGDDVPAEVVTSLKDRVVDQFVANALLNQRVDERRFVVSDKDVVASIQQIEAFQVGGQFNKDSYYALLRAQNLTPAQFEAQQRAELRTRQLEAGLFVSAFATPKEVQRLAALKGETREVAYAIIPAARFEKSVNVNDAAVQAYYDAHKADFVAPESVTLAYVRLRISDIEKAVAVDDAALRAYYDTVKARYIEPEKRRARHILIQSGADDAAAKKKAEDVYAQVTKPGADFAAIAKTASQDAGSAPQGGDLGWAEKSFFVGPFADALFAMKPGEISKPVKTQFGWHVIRLEEVQAGKQKSFEDARAELETEYRRTEAERLFNERQEKLDQLAFENNGSLDGVAKALDLKVETIPGFTKTAGGGDFTAATPKVLASAFSPDVIGGQNSRAIELAPGDVLVLRASDHKAPAQRALADVRAEAEAGARRELAEREAKAAAEGIAKDVQAGKPLEAALKALSNVIPADKPGAAADAVKYQAPKFVSRSEAGAPAELVSLAFRAHVEAGKPVVATAGVKPSGYGVYVVSQVKPGVAPADGAAEQRTAAQDRGRTDVFGYVAAMRDRADVHYSPTVFD
jgi:peptidyl-prolyl cis-trans isomerase D